MNEMHIAFCLHCGRKTAYTVAFHPEKLTVRGNVFSYTEQVAHCAECGNEVYVPVINDANVQAREDGYGKAVKAIADSYSA